MRERRVSLVKIGELREEMSVVRKDLTTEERFEIANGVLELFGTGDGGSGGESGGGEGSGVEVGGEEDGEDWIGGVG